MPDGTCRGKHHCRLSCARQLMLALHAPQPSHGLSWEQETAERRRPFRDAFTDRR
jgi:hypothetical protein